MQVQLQPLAQHQINEMCPEVVGFHGTNSGLTNNSPSRNTMYSSHASQHLVITGAQIPLVLSGTEVDYSQYTTADRVKWDARVVQVIDRYPRGISENSLKFNPERFVVVCNDSTGEYDIISVPYYKSYHQYFGYKNELSDDLETITPGTRLAKDTKLGDTPANIGEFYTMTTNLNCMLASPDVVAEDSVLVCEDIKPLLEYRVYERRRVSIGLKKFPINRSSDPNKYEGIPEIGSWIDESGELVRLREYSEGLSPALMSVSSVRNTDYTFDEIVYARQGHRGRVVDIRVIGNAHIFSSLPPQMAEQLEKYRQAYISFNNELLACYRRIKQESKNKFGSIDVNLSDTFHRMLIDAQSFTDRAQNRDDKSLQLLMNKNPVDEYLVDFVIEYTLMPTIGGKGTGTSGDKGVFTQFLPRHRMPVDKSGRSADIVMGTDGTIARTNYARLYLMQAGAYAEAINDRLKEITGLDHTATEEDVQYLNQDYFNQAWDLMMAAHHCVNPPVEEIFQKLPTNKKWLHLAEVLESGFIFVRDIASPRPWSEAVILLDDLVKITYDTVTHQLIQDGRSEETIEPMLIAKLPIMLLDKTAEDTLTVATAAHGPFGVLNKHNQADKYSKPWKDSPPRTLGESEMRTYVSHTKDPEMAVDMIDRANNPEVQLAMARTIVSSLTPGYIESVVDRSIHDYGNSRPLAIAENLFQAYGVTTTYVPEDMNPLERSPGKGN